MLVQQTEFCLNLWKFTVVGDRNLSEPLGSCWLSRILSEPLEICGCRRQNFVCTSGNLLVQQTEFCLNLWELTGSADRILSESLGTYRFSRQNFVWTSGNWLVQKTEICLNLWELTGSADRILSEPLGTYWFSRQNFVWTSGNLLVQQTEFSLVPPWRLLCFCDPGFWFSSESTAPIFLVQSAPSSFLVLDGKNWTWGKWAASLTWEAVLSNKHGLANISEHQHLRSKTENHTKFNMNLS